MSKLHSPSASPVVVSAARAGQATATVATGPRVAVATVSTLAAALTLAATLTLAAALTLAGGCKGGTTVKDNPETMERLKSCSDKLGEKDKALAALEADLARIKLEAGSGANEFVVTIQGDALEVKARPSGGNGAPAISDAVTVELSKKYIELVRKSRGNIQKCYEQALKKNASLQARTISLTVTARYGASGDVTKASFRPDSLGAAFDTCMQAVAKNWKLSAQAGGMSFQSTVTLSPS